MKSKVKKYGKTEEEKGVEDSIQCREIVVEILNFGINEFQKMKLIYLISLELEDRDHMLEVSDLIKKLLNEEKPQEKLLTLE
tara:strand:- start:588 stop:833 length:246 start_codon:yes stop_codon:yes gene_type:complete